MLERRELQIVRLGAQGDGVAETPSGLVYVPFTLQGERVVADVEGERGWLVEVLEASGERVAPPCRHFGTCGGCALQHMKSPTYLAWKKAQVVEAFRPRGITAPVAGVVACSGKRRRAAFSARQASGGQSVAGVTIGFHEAGSHDLVDLKTCEVLHPGIVAALPLLRELVRPMLSRRSETRVVATWTHGGLDVGLEEVAAKLTPVLRAHIARTAGEGGIARISVNGDPVYEGLQPILKFGNVEVIAPPGSFLQAVAEAEAAMGDLVLQATGKAKRVADLFSGLGAFTFRLAERSRVFAVDSDRTAIAALQAAAKRGNGLKPIEAVARDLFREPLSATELRDFDAVVFDPPRAGAEAQAKMIARSKVKTVVAVSCNPATLARDARTLVDGGYVLESVTPIDQFEYSPHIEAVAVFRK